MTAEHAPHQAQWCEKHEVYGCTICQGGCPCCKKAVQKEQRFVLVEMRLAVRDGRCRRCSDTYERGDTIAKVRGKGGLTLNYCIGCAEDLEAS
jgi:hypothetical protein